MSTTYNAKIYREQGSTKFVCTTGGEIEMRTGSQFDQHDGSSAHFKGDVNFSSADVNVLAGTTVTFSSGATLGISSGAFMHCATVQIMTTKGSTAVTSFLHGYGVSILRANGTGGIYRMKRPAAKGVEKTIVIQSTLATKISCTSTAVNFGSTGTPQKFSFTATPSTQAVTKAGGFAINLVGISTSVWCIKGFGAIMGSSLNSGVVLVATAT